MGLKEHFEKILELNVKVLEARIAAIEKATELLALNTKEKFESVNEWRGQSKDRESTWARKEETERLRASVDDLQISRATLAGKASQQSVLVAYLISIISLVVGLISFFSK